MMTREQHVRLVALVEARIVGEHRDEYLAGVEEYYDEANDAEDDIELSDDERFDDFCMYMEEKDA